MIITFILILLLVICVGLLYMLIRRNYLEKKFTLNYNIKNIIVTRSAFYALGKNKIGKFKKNGPKIIVKKFPMDIKCGKIVNNDLIVLENHKFQWLNPNTLEFIDEMELESQPLWFDWYQDQWWLGTKNNVYAFDINWQCIGEWKIPTNTFGEWANNYLYILNKNKAMILKLNPKKEKAKIVKTFSVPDIDAITFKNMWMSHENVINTF